MKKIKYIDGKSLKIICCGHTEVSFMVFLGSLILNLFSGGYFRGNVIEGYNDRCLKCGDTFFKKNQTEELKTVFKLAGFKSLYYYLKELGYD